MAIIPSPLRTVAVPYTPFGSVILRQPLQFPGQADPSTVAYYWVDFTNWLLAESGGQPNTITNAEISVVSGDGALVLLPNTAFVYNGALVGVQIGNGTPGEIYDILFQANDALDPTSIYAVKAQLTFSSVPSEPALGGIVYTLSLNSFSEILNGAPVNTPAISGGVYLAGANPYALYFVTYTGTVPSILPPLSIVNDIINTALVNSSPDTGGVYLVGGETPYAIYFQPFTGQAPPGQLTLQVFNSVLNDVPINSPPPGGGLYLIGSGSGPYQVCFKGLS